MKKLKTSDILANKLELSKSAIVTLAIQDFSKRMEDYSDFFDIGTGKVANEVIRMIKEDNVITVEHTISSFYAILIELEKRKSNSIDRGSNNNDK
jgi:hypothetical protein